MSNRTNSSKTLMICFHPSLMTWNNDLKQWFESNCLSLNVLKTKRVFTGTQHKISLLPSEPDICLDSHSIERVSSYNYLGGGMIKHFLRVLTFQRSVVKSQKYLLPWGDGKQFVPRRFLSQFTNHWFCLIAIIVVMTGEMVSLVKDLRN